MIAVGEVIEVVQEPQAVFLNVALRDYSRRDGLPVEARARWCPQHHGAGFGTWFVPDVGTDVLCAFPGVGPDGRIEDLDEGFAFAFVSSTPEPPVDGLEGDLSATRAVVKGKLGVALDRHHQGALDVKVDGPESRETVGVLEWLLRAASKLIGDVKITIDAPTLELGVTGAIKKIVHEEAIAVFNAHTHGGVQSGGAITAPPTQQLAVGTHTSTRARVDS